MNNRRVHRWRSFANHFCHLRRRKHLPVNHHALAIELHRCYSLTWGSALEFSQKYVDAWLIREEKRTYKSVRNGAIYASIQNSIT